MQHSVDAYLRGLSADDDTVRRSAVEALGELGDSNTAVLNALCLAATQDTSEKVRKRSVESLRKLSEIPPSEDVVESLITALGDEDNEVGLSARKSLTELGVSHDMVTTSILNTLQNSSNNNNNSNDKTFNDDGRSNTATSHRLRALQAAKRLFTTTATTTNNYYNNNNNSNRESLVGVLTDIVLNTKDTLDCRAAAITAVGMCGSDSSAVTNLLIDVLKNTENENTIRAAAALSLGTISGSHVELRLQLQQLFSQLLSTSQAPEIAKSMIHHVGLIEEKILLDILMNKDYDATVRSEAARHISRLPSSSNNSSLHPLIQTLSQTNDMSIKLTVIQSMGFLHPTNPEDQVTLVKALVHALETEKFKYIRKNAVDSLARLVGLSDSLNETIIDALLVALQDSESMVSRRACEVLTNLYRDHVTQHSEEISSVLTSQMAAKIAASVQDLYSQQTPRDDFMQLYQLLQKI